MFSTTSRLKKKYPYNVFRHKTISYRGFPTTVAYFYCISCLRYTILVGNPRYVQFIKCLVDKISSGTLIDYKKITYVGFS